MGRGVGVKILSPIEEVSIYEMHKAGKTIAEIAYEYKVSPSTVQRTVRKFKQATASESMKNFMARRKMSMPFMYDHEDRLNQLLELDGTRASDIKRKALFFIISGDDELYRHVDLIYDFKARDTKQEFLRFKDSDISFSSRKLLKVALNLYNGYPIDISDAFSKMEKWKMDLAFDAIKIRFNRG